MSLTIGMRNFAEVRVRTPTLRPIAGAFELLFPLDATVNPGSDPRLLGLVHGAQITAQGSAGHTLVGFARPEMPIRVRPQQFSLSATWLFGIALLPQQLAAIEALRGAGDLTFELRVLGEGFDGQAETLINNETWRVQIPRSAWIEQMRLSGAMNILLLEVPIPIEKGPEGRSSITESLQNAQRHFLDGDFRACVSSCRDVVQQLGESHFKQEEWAAPSLDRLANRRAAMTKGEREAAILAAVRHYTHQAHHTEAEGGAVHYYRSEAQLILMLSAALVARGYGR